MRLETDYYVDRYLIRGSRLYYMAYACQLPKHPLTPNWLVALVEEADHNPMEYMLWATVDLHREEAPPGVVYVSVREAMGNPRLQFPHMYPDNLEWRLIV